MAQRDDANSSSRRVFLAWMMALPIAGRVAAQSSDPAQNQTQTAWRDEFDPTKTAKQKERSWLDENRDQPQAAKQQELSWRDEFDPTKTAKQKERNWLDENRDHPSTAKQKERCWLDENRDQPSTAKQKERCWLDENRDRPQKR